MVKIFIDTEFTRLPLPHEWSPDPTSSVFLISVGLVSESGDKSFYAEQTDGWHQSDCGKFTIETVLPLLVGGNARRSKEQLSNDLFDWVASFNEPVVFYCDFIVDWYFVRNLLIGRPIQIDYELVSYWSHDELIAHEWMLKNYFNPTTRPQHHALNDAAGLRKAWISINSVET